MHYTRQGDPRGLGHAVLCAARHVGDEPFAVLLGDDLIDPRDPLLATMLDVRERARRQRRRPDAGAARADRPLRLRGRRADADEDGVVTVTDLVEKPPVDEAPSNLAIIGRYVLAPARLRRAAQDRPRPRRRDPAHRRAAHAGRVRRARPGARRRLQAAAATTPVTGWTTSRPSCGSPASVPTSGPDFPRWLREFVDDGARGTAEQTSRMKSSTSTWPTSSQASSRSRRSTCSCSTRTAASWPRRSSPTSTCRRSTTPRWTATPCGSPTSRRPVGGRRR